MHLPLHAWTLSELDAFAARLEACRTELRAAGFYRDASRLNSILKDVNTLASQRQRDLQELAARQLTLTHPGAYGEVVDLRPPPF